MSTTGIELTTNGSTTTSPLSVPPVSVEPTVQHETPVNSNAASTFLATDLEARERLDIEDGVGALATKKESSKEGEAGDRGLSPNGVLVASNEQQLQQNLNAIVADARSPQPPTYEQVVKMEPAQPEKVAEDTESERSPSSRNPVVRFMREGCGMRLCGARALELPPALVRWYVLLIVCAQQVLHSHTSLRRASLARWQ